jgi:hypothetical protein
MKITIKKSTAKTAFGLLSEIRQLILEEPKRYDQQSWRTPQDEILPGEMPACGAVGCVFGWVDLLKSSRPITMKQLDLSDSLFAKRGMRILGLSRTQAAELYHGGAAGGRRSDLKGHARRGAAHIARFQKKYASQLKAKRV